MKVFKTQRELECLHGSQASNTLDKCVVTEALMETNRQDTWWFPYSLTSLTLFPVLVFLLELCLN